MLVVNLESCNYLFFYLRKLLHMLGIVEIFDCILILFQLLPLLDKFLLQSHKQESLLHLEANGEGVLRACRHVPERGHHAESLKWG